ncbi:Serine/threonine-protein [Carex littledalei]|uniref:Serine/threonine-protein n=1 Tax=Carex littledalei TaxID=544730 RepID=A0A833QCK3_9POAL|nr:Serine/threonine-protein [Carex littledalei]
MVSRGHTFHMPFGEMTVTLQDVSALWGLPIRGTPVCGVSDSTRFVGDVEELLGADPAYIIGDNGRSKFHLRMTRLRQHFSTGLSADSTALEIQRIILEFYMFCIVYTRGYVIDLFGSVMFPDSCGDHMPMMYLPLLRDLEQPERYNWGGAVLAYLYSHLCRSSEPNVKQMYGPVHLLQHWSWSRLPVGRPIPNEAPQWGELSMWSFPAYGKKWHGGHNYQNRTHCATVGIRPVRMNHRGRLDKDWSTHFDAYCGTAQDPQYLDFYHEPDPIQQTQGDPQLRYDTWYMQICMASVYLRGDYGAHLRDMIQTDDGYHPSGRSFARNFLAGIKECAHGISTMGKKNWRYRGYRILKKNANAVEDAGHGGKIITMLRDAGENINWREINPIEPDPEPIIGQEFPPSPDSHPEWDYHDWVLSNVAWQAWYDEHGRPVQPHDYYGILDDEFSSAPRVPRYDTDAADGEASGSGSHTQPAFETEFAASIFSTPPLVPTVPTGDARWDTADQILRSVDASVETERDRVWPRKRRANAGVPPQRWSPSPF